MILYDDKFLDTVPKAKCIKEKIYKLDYIMLKNFCFAKDKCQENGKTSHRLERIFERECLQKTLLIKN